MRWSLNPERSWPHVHRWSRWAEQFAPGVWADKRTGDLRRGRVHWKVRRCLDPQCTATRRRVASRHVIPGAGE